MTVIPIQRIEPILPSMFFGSRTDGDKIIDWVVAFGGSAGLIHTPTGEHLEIKSRNGYSTEIRPNDWVFHDVNSDYFVRISPEVFDAHYRKVETLIG